MPDKNAEPPGGQEARDPWAAPQHPVPLDKPAGGQPEPPTLAESAFRPPAGPADSQSPTVGSGFGPPPGAVPPPPAAPGAPGQPPAGPYGYPGFPPGAAEGVPRQPVTAYGGGPGYGYPGYPGYPGAGGPGWQQAPANGMGVAAMVLGILSVCLFCLYGVGGIILGVLALIFGIIGRRRAKQGTATNSGQALAGIILGSIGIVIGALVIGFIIWAVNKDDDNSDENLYDDGYATSLVTGAGPQGPPSHGAVPEAGAAGQDVAPRR